MSGKKGKKIDDLVSIFKVARAFSVLQKAELSARVGGPQTSWSPPPPPPPPPSNFIAGRPKAAFLFWLFSDRWCGVPLLSLFLWYVILKIGKNICKLLDKPVTICMGNSCSPDCCWWFVWWHLFVLSFFPGDVLDEILDRIETISEGFPSYSCLYSISEKKRSKLSRMVDRKLIEAPSIFISGRPQAELLF